MRFWFAALFDAIFALPWRQPTPDEVIHSENEYPSGSVRTAPLHPAVMTMRFVPRKPSADLPPRRGKH
jgi:hypothetical protein